MILQLFIFDLADMHKIISETFNNYQWISHIKDTTTKCYHCDAIITYLLI